MTETTSTAPALPVVDETDLEWWHALAPSLQWTYARSMPQYPHSYVIRGEQLDEQDYLRAMAVILAYGEPGAFYGKPRVYLYSADRSHRWWLMSRDPGDSRVLNYAPAPPPGQDFGPQPELNRPRPRTPSPQSDSEELGRLYTGMSGAYDGRYDTDECRAENHYVWRQITERVPDVRYPSTLDIGAGTGLAVDIRVVSPQGGPDRYRAVDPSQGMLNELVLKHPWATDLWPCTFEQYLAGTLPRERRTFDQVLALFGAASYLRPESIRTIPHQARRLVFLMHYRPGYYPDYHTEETMPAWADESREVAAELHGAETWMYHNFQITAVRR